MLIPQFNSKSAGFTWQGLDWEWLPNRILWHAESRSAFLTDFHIGKAEAFQRAGINLPNTSSSKQIQAFFEFVAQHNMERVFLLGDLLHGPTTTETTAFLKSLEKHKELEFHWILGNHDQKFGTTFGKDLPNLKRSARVQWNGIELCHEPKEASGLPFMCGHLHPGIRIPSGARQNLTLPCGILSADSLILPAFGTLTGLQIQAPNLNTTYFIFTGQEVHEIAFKKEHPAGKKKSN
jgi:DNA ligase-associated metallophosphoesterase